MKKFVLGELHGGGGGFCCDTKKCRAKTWTLILSDADEARLINVDESRVSIFINMNNLGVAVCKKHEPI